MSIRIKDDKPGAESPRLKDTPLLPAGTGRQRSDNHDASGRFVGGNGAANGRAAKALLRPRADEGADAEFSRAVAILYRACMRDLPADGPAVRQLVASQSRHAILAMRFTEAAAEAGLTSKDGLKLAEQARAHDLAAQRLAVTAHDLAVREARRVAAEQGSVADPLAIVADAEEEHDA